MSINDLKREILILAGYLDPTEQMSRADAKLSMEALAKRIYSDRLLTPVTAALIALELARALDAG
jgi:hypothetical protein